MERRTLRPRAVIAVVLIVMHTGCMSAPRAVPSPANYLRTNSPSKAWITMNDGSSHVIEQPRVFGDSLLAIKVSTTGEENELWVPLNSIREVQVRRVSMAKTALLVAGVAVGVVLFATVVMGGGEKVEVCNPTNPEDCN
jgi:hypothetical protein